MAKQRRVSSRLIKKERKKLTKQIIWFSVLAVLLVLFFLFVVLPVFVRVMNGIIDTNPITDNTGTEYVQAPIISAPPEYTADQQLTISGYAQADSEVIAVINGREAETAAANTDGEFELSIGLSEGENSVAVYSKKEDVESPTSKQFLVVLDTEVPTIELSSPDEGATYNVKDDTVEVAGKTDPDSKLYIDGRIVYPNADGEFSKEYQLREGDLEISIRAVDQAGNETEIIRKIKAE